MDRHDDWNASWGGEKVMSDEFNKINALSLVDFLKLIRCLDLNNRIEYLKIVEKRKVEGIVGRMKILDKHIKILEQQS